MERECEGEALPEECIANILSHTTPLDACRLSLVSRTFCSASHSDAIWDRFLPSDLISIISRSDSHSTLLANSPSKKSLYLALSQNPILIDNATKSFQLDKKTAKKCYMLAARALTIAWGDTPQYWNWKNLPESRFPEVAQLLRVCWLEIRGSINTYALSQKTCYAAYLVFKMIDADGFHRPPVVLSAEVMHHLNSFQLLRPPRIKTTRPFEFEDDEGQMIVVETTGDIVGGQSSTGDVCLNPNLEERRVHNILEGINYYPHHRLRRSRVRSDGWLEIELNDFYVHNIEYYEDYEVQMSVKETIGGNWKSGLIIEGIEVRPKERS